MLGSLPSSQKRSQKVASLRSGFGSQCLTRLKTAPSVGFGSSVREAGARTYVSPEVDKAQCKAQGGNNSQGSIYKTPDMLGKQHLSTHASAPMPGFGVSSRPSMATRTAAPGPGAYKTKTTLGKQVESRNASSAAIGFGLSSRDASEKIFLSVEHEKAGYGRDSPGPSAYTQGSGLGRQTRSDRDSLPQWRLGTERRFQYDFVRRAAGLPGPGQYSQQSAVGIQTVSTKSTNPRIGFAYADRDASKKMFISVDHEKANFGTCSPGPTTALHSARIGCKQLSNQPQTPSWRFGTGRRLPQGLSDTPGPGEYYA